MSLNRNLVAAAAATFALVVVAIPATQAQQDDPNQRVDGTDLVILLVEPNVETVDKPVQLRFTVKNNGKETFTSATGWQVVISYNTPGTCIISTAAVPTASECYKRFPRNDTMNTLISGETKTFVVNWVPGTPHVGAGRIITEIQPFGANCYGTPQVNCDRDDETGQLDGPDTQRGNNLQSFSWFGRKPGVQAVPLREPTKNPADANVNTHWLYQDITAECPRDPNEVARTACKAQPGQLVTFAYNVVNKGNWVDTFTPTVVEPADSPDQPGLTRRNYTWNFSPRLVTLEPNQSREVLLQVYVPPTERANNQTNVNASASVKVRWTSGLNSVVTTQSPPGCNPQLTPGICTDPSFPSLVIGVKHGLNATSNETLRIANVTQEVTFNVTLNNTGNFADTYSITMDNETAEVNDSWLMTPRLPITVSLAEFEKRTITIKMTPPLNATKGLHRFNLTFQSVGDSDAKTRQTLRFAADLQQNFSIAGGESTSVIHALPAQKATYPLRIVNNGNGVDNVTLNLENVPFGWSGGLSQRVVAVPAFGSATVYLNVTPPPNTVEGHQAAFFVNATSQGPPEKSPEQRPTARFVLNLRVLGGPNLDVAAPTRTAFVDAGATTDYELTVRNVGNQRSNFSIVVNRSQDQLAWSVRHDPGFLLLDPLQSGTLKVTVGAPGNGDVGETAKVFVTVTATNDPAVFAQTTLEGQISGPDLFVENVLVNSTNPYSGDPLELSVLLGNKGNKPPLRNATMKVFFIQGGVPRLVAEKDYLPIDLPGGRRMSERIVWDTTGVEGEGTLVARIDEDDLIEEIDDSPAGNEATKPMTLRVFDIRVVPATGLSGLPGEHISYSESPHVFIVEYRGNQPSEPVDITLESEHGWGSSQLSVSLQRGTPLAVHAEIDIPQDPGVAKDTLRLTVVPRLRPEAVITTSTTTTVLDETPPTILGVTASPPTAKLGETVTIRADVRDATGLSSVRAFIVTPGNETVSVLLQKLAGDAWTHSQPFTLAGTYRLYIEAVDGSDDQNKNSSRDTVVSFVISPGSAPSIKLLDGQSTTVKAGAFVRLDISDPLGIDQATYTIRGITYPLQRPYSIDTAGFPQGAVEVTVNAQNIYGVASSAKFNLTVDSTAPTIREVKLSPDRPRVNEDATLRIATETNVDTVEVTIKKDGQILDTRSAARRSAGVFELLLNLEEGSYVLDVTARDEAGNVKLMESAVSFDAKPGSPIPGPGVALVLAAVGALVVALRRRR